MMEDKLIFIMVNKKLCCFTDCGEKIHARFLCNRHYHIAKRKGHFTPIKRYKASKRTELHRKYNFSGNYYKVLKRDKNRCVYCNITNYRHKMLSNGRSLLVHHVNGRGSNLKGSERNNEMESIILSVSNLLVKTSGNPDNWEDLGFEEINSIGFAERDHVLDNEKISKFYDMNSTYENTTGLLGVRRYGFYLTMTNLTGEKIFLGGEDEFGIEPTAATDVHSVTRTGLLDEPEQIIFLKIILWR